MQPSARQKNLETKAERKITDLDTEHKDEHPEITASTKGRITPTSRDVTSGVGIARYDPTVIQPDAPNAGSGNDFYKQHSLWPLNANRSHVISSKVLR